MFCKKRLVFSRTFIKFTGKHLCQSLLLNKVRPATLLKKRLWHRCFLVNFVKFLRTLFLTEHLWWLLLTLYKPVIIFAFLQNLLVQSCKKEFKIALLIWFLKLQLSTSPSLYMVFWHLYFSSSGSCLKLMKRYSEQLQSVHLVFS